MSETLQGLGVSPGIAVGRVLLLRPHAAIETPLRSSTDDVAGEIARLRRVRERARDDLQELRDRIRQVLGEHYAAVFEAQLLILDDPTLVSEAERRIEEEGVVAPWALREAVESFARKFEEVGEGFFRERGGDLGDVHRRLQRLLRGELPRRAGSADGPLVLVAHSLGPSEAVALVREGVLGLATDVGGPTSHTAILAQALSIPAVVGLRDVSARVASGASVVLDGERGTVVIDPEPGMLEDAALRRETWLARESAMARRSAEPVVTRDGTEVVLRANIELPVQIDAALRYGAHGVGLYRSEFLYVTRAPVLPSEEDHYREYRAMAERIAPYPAVIRTLDFGGEQYFQRVLGQSEPNPVLGLRAVRFCLSRPDVFLPQLRALLRAAVHGDVRILLPLVTTREEVVEVRRLLARGAQDLAVRGIPFRADLPLGAMVETPAAAILADILAGDLDFFSIGTNDLIQYALAVDRGNEAVAHLYKPLHPAVIRMLDFVVRSAGVGRIPVALCGEMAGDPSLVPLLIGLGLRELSVEPRALPAVADAVRASSIAEARELARGALDCSTADEVASLLETAPREGRS